MHKNMQSGIQMKRIEVNLVVYFYPVHLNILYQYFRHKINVKP